MYPQSGHFSTLSPRQSPHHLLPWAGIWRVYPVPSDFASWLFRTSWSLQSLRIKIKRPVCRVRCPWPLLLFPSVHPRLWTYWLLSVPGSLKPWFLASLGSLPRPQLSKAPSDMIQIVPLFWCSPIWFCLMADFQLSCSSLTLFTVGRSCSVPSHCLLSDQWVGGCREGTCWWRTVFQPLCLHSRCQFLHFKPVLLCHVFSSSSSYFF